MDKDDYIKQLEKRIEENEKEIISLGSCVSFYTKLITFEARVERTRDIINVGEKLIISMNSHDLNRVIGEAHAAFDVNTAEKVWNLKWVDVNSDNVREFSKTCISMKQMNQWMKSMSFDKEPYIVDHLVLALVDMLKRLCGIEHVQVKYMKSN